MRRLIVMCGAPGCGKSTYAVDIVNEMWSKGEKAAVISTDFIREYLLGDASCQLFGNKVFAEAEKQIRNYLYQDFTVVFDAMNLRPKDRKWVLKIAKDCGVDTVECHYFTTPLEVCIKRQDTRERKVPENVIVKKYNAMVIPSVDEGFTAVIPVKYTETK